MKKFVLVGAFALAALSLSEGKASAWCYQVYCPCWEIPLPKFPIVIPNIKFTCAECCPPAHNFTQPWYLYYPPQAQYGYSSPWFNYAGPQAYPYAAAPQGYGNYAATPQGYGNYAATPQGYGNYAAAPQQGYAAPEQVYAAPRPAPNYAPQGYYAGQNYGAQGNFAPPPYWYGR